MLWRTLTASFLVMLTMAAGGTPSPAAEQPANGRIVFSFVGRLTQVNADGTGAWPLVPDTAVLAPGDWSPDGSRLAVVSEGDLYLVDPRGRRKERLTFREYIVNPSFSPDGTTIAFESARGGVSQIWLLDADGTSPRPWSPCEAGPAFDPTWSPDGNAIAFASNRNGGWEIDAMDIDGTRFRRLTHGTAVDKSPAWSPDGSRIAFQSDRDGSFDVYTMAPDGSDVEQLTASPPLDQLPEWSPDGRQIAFLSERSGEGAVFVMRTSGAGQTRLFVAADLDASLAWQPISRDALTDANWRPFCTIFGTSADDLLVGTPGRDVICGGEGDDRLLGGEGGDTLVGGDGRDSVVGGPGRDTVVASPGDDLIDTRDGVRDGISGGPGRDTALIDHDMDGVIEAELAFDPDLASLTRGHAVRSSFTIPTNPAEYTVDGHIGLFWNAGSYAPQWVEVDLGSFRAVGGIQLVVAQAPAGETLHVVLGQARSGRWRRLTSFAGETRDGQVLRYTPPKPWRGIRSLRIVTRQSPSWVAWKEVRAFAP